MSDDNPFDMEWDTTRNDGVDRSRWKFDENGFKIGTDIASKLARQALKDHILTIHEDIMQRLHPNYFDVKISGVPIEKTRFHR